MHLECLLIAYWGPIESPISAHEVPIETGSETCFEDMEQEGKPFSKNLGTKIVLLQDGVKIESVADY